MDAWEIIESCQLAGDNYDKRQCVRIIAEMTQEEFHRFCRTIIHLYHFYETNLHAWATDEPAVIEVIKEKFWQLKEIDFDMPLNFRRLP